MQTRRHFSVHVSQLEPTGDQVSVELLTEFEEFIYASVARSMYYDVVSSMLP
jgi:hypothetical protein